MIVRTVQNKLSPQAQCRFRILSILTLTGPRKESLSGCVGRLTAQLRLGGDAAWREGAAGRSPIATALPQLSVCVTCCGPAGKSLWKSGHLRAKAVRLLHQHYHYVIMLLLCYYVSIMLLLSLLYSPYCPLICLTDGHATPLYPQTNAWAATTAPPSRRPATASPTAPWTSNAP